MRTTTLILSLLLLYSCGKDPGAKDNLATYDNTGNLISRGDTTQWTTSNDSNLALKYFGNMKYDGGIYSLRAFYEGLGWKLKYGKNEDIKVVLYPNPIHGLDKCYIRIKMPPKRRILFMSIIFTNPDVRRNDFYILYPTRQTDSTLYIVEPFRPWDVFLYGGHISDNGSSFMSYDVVTDDSCSHVGHGYVKILPP